MPTTHAGWRGGWNRCVSHRPRRRKDTGRRAAGIRLDEGWYDRLLEPRIAPAVLDLAGGVLSYTAASGEVNKLSVDVVPVSGTSYIRFQDQGAGVVIKPQGTGLIADSTTAVRAPAASVKSISISTDDGNDTIRLALGVGMPASISVNVDPPAAADGTVTIPNYSPDQLTIVGPNGADTMALTPQLAPDGTKDIVLADALIRSNVALEHMSSLTIDLSASTGQHSVTVDRSITRPEAPIALKVIGGPAGSDSLTVTAPGTIPQTFALTGGSIKTSDVRTGKELMLGPSDNIAIDQPQVAVDLQTTDSSGNPVDLGPSIFNTFLLDTGSTSILSAADATGDLESSGLYQVYPTQYLEQGVAGYTAMDVSHPYQFYFAGSSGIPHEVSNTKILSSDNLQFSFLGPDGIVGMPAMLNRFTSIDMSGWENPQTLDNLSIQTDFPTGTGIPTNSGHWYQVPVNLVNFPNDGQLPGGPIPTSAPLAMIPVTIRENGREVTSNFLLDTGAQLSMVSPSVATALNLDLSHPSGSIDVGGVGGTVTVPLVPVDQLDVKATNGTSLGWSDLQVGVLDLSVPGGPTIGGVFGMDFLTSGWAAKILPALLGQPGSSQNGYFDHVYLDYRNSSSGTGTIIFDVDPSRDAPAPPDPHTFSVSYSSIAGVHAVGGNGSDTFNVTPSQTVAYTIDGGSQPTGGADVLGLVPGNPQAVTNGSTITIPGDKGINYLNIEKLNLGSTSGTASTILDSGYEQVQVGAGQFRARPTGSPWAFAGSSGLSANGSGYTAGNPPAPQGTQVAFLQGVGSFSQSAAGWAAGSYTLTFDAAQRANFQASRQNFSVLVDGNVVGSFTPSGTSYGSYTTASFTVTAGSHTITFRGLDSAGGDNTAFIDAVVVAPAGTPAILSAGFGGGAYVQWPASGHVPIGVTNVSGINAAISGLFLDGSPTSASGLATPISVTTPQALDATLRTAVLTDPVNRFERMLSEIAALRGRKLAARSTPPSIDAAPGQKPGVEQYRGARTGVWAARVSDPVQDEALFQIMALDPILLKPKAKNLFS